MLLQGEGAARASRFGERRVRRSLVSSMVAAVRAHERANVKYTSQPTKARSQGSLTARRDPPATRRDSAAHISAPSFIALHYQHTYAHRHGFDLCDRRDC